MEGQLWDDERELLYNTIKAVKPRHVLESGTWKGGGSTWQIVRALTENRSGHLHTCETNAEFLNTAKGLYIGFENISFYNAPALDVIKILVESGRCPSVAFLDGSEDPEVTLAEFIALDSVMAPGSVVLVHDWDLGVRADGNVSTKCQLLRPALESHSGWRIDVVLSAPVSVGMVKAVKV